MPEPKYNLDEWRKKISEQWHRETNQAEDWLRKSLQDLEAYEEEQKKAINSRGGSSASLERSLEGFTSSIKAKREKIVDDYSKKVSLIYKNYQQQLRNIEEEDHVEKVAKEIKDSDILELSAKTDFEIERELDQREQGWREGKNNN